MVQGEWVTAPPAGTSWNSFLGEVFIPMEALGAVGLHSPLAFVCSCLVWLVPAHWCDRQLGRGNGPVLWRVMPGGHH